MMKVSARPRNREDEFAGNLFLLVLDTSGALVGFVPMTVLQSMPLSVAQTHLIEGKAEHVGTESKFVAPPLYPLESLRLHVESALRRLYDYLYLGQHPLADLRLIRVESPENESLLVGRGRALSALLHRVIEQLRPPGPVPARLGIPSREWHAYLILHCAYIEGQNNTAIMSWLQLSEGTFNRARRRAAEGVAQVLQDLEHEGK